MSAVTQTRTGAEIGVRIASEYLNVFVVLASCVAAHLWPYHVLVLSYAVLGPAHYLTQVSWMHDRKYFVATPVAGAVFLLLLAGLYVVYGSAEGGSSVLGGAFAASVAMTLSRRPAAFLVAGAVGVVVGWLGGLASPLVLALAVLLPTLFHIFVFTGVFMVSGAVKSRNSAAWISFAAFVLAAASFAVVPTARLEPGSVPQGVEFFLAIAKAVNAFLPAGFGPAMFGFLGFAYAHHYLNWFAKTRIVRWTEAPPRRLGGLFAAYVVFEAAYLVDFRLGFLLTIFLSVGHVLLEFPLNVRTFKGLAESVYAVVVPRRG